MWTDETTFAFVAFFVAIVVEGVAVWYLFGRRKDAHSRQRYRVWRALTFVATVLVFWFLVFEPSWKVALLLAAMVAAVLWAEGVARKKCPSCGELLRNPEWPASLAYCYRCGARLDEPVEPREPEVKPHQPQL